MEILQRFLKDLELCGHVDEIEVNRLRYSYHLGAIDFVYLRMAGKREFFEIHSEMWCENRTEFFVTIFGEGTIHICDSKTRPSAENPIKNASIDSFRYGENTPRAQKYMRLFRKENIDTGDCLREIKKFLRNRSRMPVDKDLLQNLGERRNAIIRLLGERHDRKEIAQKIIDRCLFIRFLEDRSSRNNLKKILSDRNRKVKDLLELFDFYSDVLNGDIFEKGDIPQDIDVGIMKELDVIFGEVYTYLDFQKTLVPYSFGRIPIILISNIYEKFLAGDRRRSEGIVFTPENVVEYTINRILAINGITDKISSGSINVLDPACGSGVFLVKFLEKIIEIKERKRKLSLEEKAEIVQNCLYGIDKNNDALRIAALSLYLKIIENESTEVVDEKLFGGDKEHFMFPGLKRNGNLVEGDSLFDDVLKGREFDIIVGNPPWGYDFTETQKAIIQKRWPKVSKYQSSQCFLLRMRRWTNKDTVCGMVVNLSNFTNSISHKFRKYFIRRYSLRAFINLSRIRDITFGSGSEPACIVVFDLMMAPNDIEFITSDLSQFSQLTGIITDGHISRVSINALRKDDSLWHIYALGFDIHIDLIEFLDRNESTLEDFQDRFEVGLMKYGRTSGMTKKQFYERYKATSQVSELHFPILDSLKDVEPYFGARPCYYLKYGSHLDRARDITLFTGKKLIITRSWPIKAFLNFDTTLFDGNFFIFKLKSGYPTEYLLIFESIFNSKLARLYFGAKYLLRKQGNYSKVNLSQLKRFPIPDMKDRDEIIQDIIDTVKLLKDLALSRLITRESLKDRLDSLIFQLYGLDYYSIQQVEHYHKLEKEKRILVTDKEVWQYCKEFRETFKPLLQEGLAVNADWNISDFFGTLVRFTVSTVKRPMNDNNAELVRFISIIEKQEIEGYDRKKLFNEEKIKFYDADQLYIYKSNKRKDWTGLMAIKDANEEIGEFLSKLGNV